MTQMSEEVSFFNDDLFGSMNLNAGWSQEVLSEAEIRQIATDAATHVSTQFHQAISEIALESVVRKLKDFIGQEVFSWDQKYDAKLRELTAEFLKVQHVMQLAEERKSNHEEQVLAHSRELANREALVAYRERQVDQREQRQLVEQESMDTQARIFSDTTRSLLDIRKVATSFQQDVRDVVSRLQSPIRPPSSVPATPQKMINACRTVTRSLSASPTKRRRYSGSPDLLGVFLPSQPSSSV